MPVAVTSRAFELPPALGPDALVEALAERFVLAVEEPVTARATVVDTADRRLRAAGIDLRLEASPTGSWWLVLRPGDGRPPLRTEVAPGRRHLLVDLPPGTLRRRLAPVIEMRALLPLARLREDIRPLRVLDGGGDGKTTVRVAVVERSVIPDAPAPAVALPGRVEVTGVLGYGDELFAVEGTLAGELALERARTPVADAAVVAAGGDPDGIRTKVQVALSPGEPAAGAALAVLRDLAGMVEANLPGTLDDLDTEFLHDLRVAVRRSRSVLRELKGAFPAEPLQRQRDALKWVQAVTGAVRDLDVQLLDWDELADRLDGGRRAALDPVSEVLAAHRAQAFATLRAELTGDRYRDAWSAYRAFLTGDPGEPPTDEGDEADDGSDEAPDADRPIATVAGRRIRRVYGRMRAMGEAIDDDSPAEALHELRKRGKELRYLLELFGGLWPTEIVKPMVKTLKGLQDVLGTHQDREVQADHLRSLADELASVPGGPEALLALGALVERLEDEQHAARAAFAGRFAAFAAKDQRQVVDETFRGTG